MTAPATPHIAHYRRWLSERHGQDFADYEALRQWSVREIDAFWQSIWDYFELRSPTPHAAVLAQRKMPGAVWFPGAQVNYARQVLRHVEAAHAANMPAIVSGDESGALKETSWPELRRQAAALAIHLKAHGVGAGDRVAAYLPNIPETIIAFLATASIGAIWSVCAPDMAAPAVIDRFKQIEPKVLIACDGVTYAGRKHDRRQVIDELRRSLPTVEHVVIHGEGAHATSDPRLSDILSATGPEVDAFEPAWLPFDHPLWIVYSSGTTGLPKPIVHGHGGVILVALPLNVLHNDIGCSYHPNSLGERYHWYSSTGWIMWNCQIAGLLNGTTICIFDGSPGGSKEKPDWTVLWRFVSETKATIFGAGAAYFANCTKAGIDLARVGDLSRLRTLGSTGSPLSADTQQWFNERFARLATTNGNSEQADMCWANMSGGTDFAGAFIGANRELPQTPGLMQCRLLGAAVEAFDEQRPSRDRGSRRTRLHRAAAVDAAPVLERRGRRALSRQLFRDLSGQLRRHRPRRGVAPWRLAQDQYRRLLRDLWPQRRHDQPARPAHGNERDLFGDRSVAGGTGFDGGRPRISRTGKLHAAVRGAARGRRARRTRSRRGSTRPSRLACPAAFSPARSSPFPKFRERCRARSRNCRSRNCCSAMPSRRSSTAMRWPIPAVSTGISNSRGTRSGRRKNPARLEAEFLRQS